MIIISVLNVNLPAIIQNAIDVKNMLKSQQKLCVVVKANAYGFGSKKICRALNFLADYFAVSSKTEFFEILDLIFHRMLI